jgi:hypothetical protein
MNQRSVMKKEKSFSVKDDQAEGETDLAEK